MKTTSCFAFGCKHNSKDKCKLFRFPTDRKRKRKWIHLCRRADRECTTNDRLCSCHFNDWKKKNGPTIFPYLKAEILVPDQELTESPSTDDNPSVGVPAEPGEEEAASVAMTEMPAEEEPATAESADPDQPCENDHCCIEQKFLSERVGKLEQEEKRQRYKVAHLESQCLRLSIDRITYNSMQQREREHSLQQIIRDLSKKAAKLESQALRMTIDHIKEDKDKMLLYTSFTSDIFVVLAEILKKKVPLKYHAKWPVTRMSLENQLLLTLMKLKLNCRDLDLAERFQVSRATVTNIVHTLVTALHEILYDDQVVGMHTHAKWKGAMPKCFEEFVAAQREVELPPILHSTPRTQVERTNARIKSFEILYHIPGMYKSIATQICQLCICLANLQIPQLKEMADGANEMELEAVASS